MIRKEALREEIHPGIEADDPASLGNFTVDSDPDEDFGD